MHPRIRHIKVSRGTDFVGIGWLERTVGISGLRMARGFAARLWRHTSWATPKSFRIARRVAFRTKDWFGCACCSCGRLSRTADDRCRPAEMRAGQSVIPAVLRVCGYHGPSGGIEHEQL